MHSSTITAFLLPLLLSSVLAVPTPVQKGPTEQSHPPPALTSLVNNLEKSGQPAAAEWAALDVPGRKRALKGRQPDLAATLVGEGDTAPAAVNPNAGETTEALDAEQGMESEAQAQAAGQDPSLCHGSCKRSLKGRQDDATDPDEDLPPIQQQVDASKVPGVSTAQADIDKGEAVTEYEKSVGQDVQPGTT